MSQIIPLICNFDNILLEDRSDLWSYTGASGVNYRFVIKKPELIDYFIGIAEREQKEKDAAAAKRVALLESIGFEEIQVMIRTLVATP